ncbi:MAG TPA: hypothetical protein VIC08_03455 [Cellvibrionaceae bacterium]
MPSEHLKSIRQKIQAATEREGETLQLVKCLASRAPDLHNAIRLPDNTAPEVLADFLVHYIEQAPNVVEALFDIAKRANIVQQIGPLLNIAMDYFLTPPSIIRDRRPLEALIHQAYLAHRLLEEINDRFIILCGAPLAPIDMTRANIIVHELIGEPFANELDQAVLFSAELLLSEYHFLGEAFDRFFAEHRQNGWSREISRWPCLTKDLAISLDFGH